MNEMFGIVTRKIDGIETAFHGISSVNGKRLAIYSIKLTELDNERIYLTIVPNEKNPMILMARSKEALLDMAGKWIKE